jgi:hypothetical protein
MAYGVVPWQNVYAIEIADVLRSATGEIWRRFATSAIAPSVILLSQFKQKMEQFFGMY